MNRENETNKWTADATGKPHLVADILHVLNPQVNSAILSRDGKSLAAIVEEQIGAGAGALAVNLGPGREVGRRTAWVVETIQSVARIPLFFSANILDHPDVLRTYGQCITINAVTANPEEVGRALEKAQPYGCPVVVLLARAGKRTTGVHDKILLADKVLELADTAGFPRAGLYFDPVLTCHSDPSAWRISRGRPDIGAAVETISLLGQLDTDVKTIVALGNIPGTLPGHRSAMYRVFADAGVDAVLLNCRKNSLLSAPGKGGRVPLSTAA